MKNKLRFSAHEIEKLLLIIFLMVFFLNLVLAFVL